VYLSLMYNHILMISSSRNRINELKKDREHGATHLTLTAVDILKTISVDSSAQTPAAYIKEIDSVVNGLIKARPSMVSIANYSIYFRDEINLFAARDVSIDALKRKTKIIAEQLLKLIESCSVKAASRASALIAKRNIIMICSYSSAVCSTLEHARKKGIDFKVLVTESNNKRKSYGNLAAVRLEKSGIVCKIIPDDQVNWHVARANTVLLGADAVSAHGWIINGKPSFELASWASKKKVPVHVICDLAKFDVKGFLTGIYDPETGFDMVPLEMISGIMTEKGDIKPEEVEKVTFGDIFKSSYATSH
jgi:translation initiation factor 2B subunit (eIF-2B alpha/beta/delta family)